MLLIINVTNKTKQRGPHFCCGIPALSTYKHYVQACCCTLNPVHQQKPAPDLAQDKPPAPATTTMWKRDLKFEQLLPTHQHTTELVPVVGHLFRVGELFPLGGQLLARLGHRHLGHRLNKRAQS